MTISSVSVLAEDKPIIISSLPELAQYAAKSGNTIKMKPGVYQLAELITPEVIKKRKAEIDAEAERRGGKYRSAYLLRFDGDDNVFDLTGVTIEVDTKLLSVFKGTYIREFQIDGDNITIEGLTIRDLGNEPTARGGNTLTVHGDRVTLRNVTLHVSGSSPYGYGDLLGKGGGSIVKLRKHSGLQISGRRTQLLGCKIYTRAFGHAFFVQGGTDIHFEDCYAEGELRPTDDMLAETSGPAFDNDFRSVYRPNVIQPNYMKSLNECGFRSYGKGGPDGRATGKVTLKNCVAKNVRVGFAFALVDGAPVFIDNAEAIECERGYYLRNAIVKNSRGDAKYGPLLYLVGDEKEKSMIDLTLTPAVSDITVNALATIAGTGHDITLRAESPRSKAHQIMIGYRPPGGGENSAPLGDASAQRIKIKNVTGMPIVLGPESRDVAVTTDGIVERDEGDSNRVRLIRNH